MTATISKRSLKKSLIKYNLLQLIFTGFYINFYIRGNNSSTFFTPQARKNIVINFRKRPGGLKKSVKPREKISATGQRDRDGDTQPHVATAVYIHMYVY